MSTAKQNSSIHGADENTRLDILR